MPYDELQPGSEPSESSGRRSTRHSPRSDRENGYERSGSPSRLTALGALLWWSGSLVGWAVVGLSVGLVVLSLSTAARCVVWGPVSVCWR